jgi:o-succinylbenzoate---CoA ligase
MNIWQTGLTIGNRQYAFEELLPYSKEMMHTMKIDSWERELYGFINSWLSEIDHIVQYSSGTTGKPKEIILRKQSMISSALNTCNYFNLREGQTALLCLPMKYIAGKMMVVRCMVRKLNLLLTEPAGNPGIPATGQIDFCAMLPLQVMNCLQDGNNFRHIKKMIIGGAEIHPGLENLLQQVSTEVYATYGMAETCSHVALRKLNGRNREEDYHALPEIILQKDERNCLVIDAAHLPDKIITNDMVEMTGPGSFKWLGRYDNLINSGGIKIIPEEVEALVKTKTALECAVTGLPDIKLGQKLVFVFEKEKMTVSLKDLKICLDNFLPKLWQPKEILFVDTIPRNNAMKVDRLILSKKISGMYLK